MAVKATILYAFSVIFTLAAILSLLYNRIDTALIFIVLSVLYLIVIDIQGLHDIVSELKEEHE